MALTNMFDLTKAKEKESRVTGPTVVNNEAVREWTMKFGNQVERNKKAVLELSPNTKRHGARIG